MELSIGEAVNRTRDREKWRSLVATSSSEERREKKIQSGEAPSDERLRGKGKHWCNCR